MCATARASGQFRRAHCHRVPPPPRLGNSDVHMVTVSHFLENKTNVVYMFVVQCASVSYLIWLYIHYHKTNHRANTYDRQITTKKRAQLNKTKKLPRANTATQNAHEHNTTTGMPTRRHTHNINQHQPKTRSTSKIKHTCNIKSKHKRTQTITRTE